MSFHISAGRIPHGIVIPTKSFVKIGITKIFCYNNKMFSSTNKTFGCCSKFSGCSNEKFICCPKFCCRNKTFFSVRRYEEDRGREVDFRLNAISQ